MKKILMIILSILFALFVIVILFFYLKQESILFHPTKTAKEYQYKFPANFTENFYNTPNDGLIHSIRFTVPDAKGVVLYLHGNAGSLEDWAWVYPQYTNRNYDVEIIDFRTYGKSTGKLSEENMYADVLFVYNELLKTYDEQNIIVHGRSIGTGMAAKIASVKSPKALILETPYYSIADIAKQMLPFLPIDLLLKYKFKSYEYVKNVKAPIYILHGTTDNVVPYASGQKLYNSITDKATFFTFENGTHSNLATFEKYQVFLDGVLDFKK